MSPTQWEVIDQVEDVASAFIGPLEEHHDKMGDLHYPSLIVRDLVRETLGGYWTSAENSAKVLVSIYRHRLWSCSTTP